MQKWEYLVFEVVGSLSVTPMVYMVNGEMIRPQIPLFDYLRQLGEQYWELVAIRNEFYYFKRPIEE